jgi:hypothetical protein
MNVQMRTAGSRDIVLENFAAELTEAAYPVALRMNGGANWLDLELNLWRILTETVKDQQDALRPCAE